MSRPLIVALLIVVAAVGFWVGRSGGGAVGTVASPAPVVRRTVTDRIPSVCGDTMRFALATWQQVTDAPFAKEIASYLASPSGSVAHASAQQDLAGEAAKLWATYGKDGGHSRTVSRCLSQWLHQRPAPTP